MVKHNDQETFVTSMHGTLLYVSAAYFSPQYIKYLEATRYTDADIDDIHLWVRRSNHFDLKDVDQRVRALELLWALISYIASGKARVNMVTAAIEAAGV